MAIIVAENGSARWTKGRTGRRTSSRQTRRKNRRKVLRDIFIIEDLPDVLADRWYQRKVSELESARYGSEHHPDLVLLIGSDGDMSWYLISSSEDQNRTWKDVIGPVQVFIQMIEILCRRREGITRKFCIVSDTADLLTNPDDEPDAVHPIIRTAPIEAES